MVMKTSALKFTLAGMLALACVTAHAQVKGVEPINLDVVSGQPVELRFPNVFDPLCPKIMNFHGIVVNTSPTGIPGGEMNIRFDWLGLSGVEVFSDPFVIPLGDIGHPVPVDISWTIPFCPQIVSIDFELVALPGATGIAHVEGVFTHECLCVPEVANTAALLGLAVLALFGAKWRRHLRCA
jgi:hypothetical protein